jgi:hypothetical protein
MPGNLPCCFTTASKLVGGKRRILFSRSNQIERRPDTLPFRRYHQIDRTPSSISVSPLPPNWVTLKNDGFLALEPICIMLRDKTFLFQCCHLFGSSQRTLLLFCWWQMELQCGNCFFHFDPLRPNGQKDGQCVIGPSGRSNFRASSKLVPARKPVLPLRPITPQRTNGRTLRNWSKRKKRFSR